MEGRKKGRKEVSKKERKKYNTSVDKTTLYLYTKIVYFVRATCFDHIRSTSDPQRRQIEEFWICILGGPEDNLIRSKHVALTKYTILVNK